MELTSRKNETVRRFRELVRDKKLRGELGTFVVEGDHLCVEALSAGLEVRCALVTRRAQERYTASC